MRKIISCFLIVVMIIAMPLGGNIKVYAKDEITIADYSVSTNKIYSGEDFTLTITFKNNSGKKVSNLYTILDSRSFHTKGNGSTLNIASELGPGESKTLSIPLNYDGGDESGINFKFIYQKEGSASVSESESAIGLNTRSKPREEDSSSPSATDTKKSKPILQASSTTSLKGNAGQYINVDLTIKNIAAYQADDVIVTPVLSDSSPFTPSGSGLSQHIEKIAAKGTVTIGFSFYIEPDASDKKYSIPINITYKNIHDDEFTASETIYINVKSSDAQTLLDIDNIKTGIESIEPGGSTDLSFDIKNLGTTDANNIKVSIQGLKEGSLSIKGGTNSKHINKITGTSSQNVKFNIRADQNAQSGSRVMTVKIDYKTSNGKPQTTEDQIFLWVNGDNSSSNLIIGNINSPRSGVQPNKPFVISFTIQNNDSTPAKNVKVSINGGDQIVPVSQSVQFVKEIKANEKKGFSFKLQPTSEAVNKNYPVSIEVQCGGKDADKSTSPVIKQYVGIYVDKTGGKGAPKIIIDRYSITPNIVNAGQNFNINMSFLNTNITNSISNIKATVSTTEGAGEAAVTVFSPVNGTNTFYIGNIPPQSTASKSMIIHVNPEAKSQNYTLNVNFEYDDKDGKEYKSTEAIGIPVVQASKIQTGVVNVQGPCFVGQPVHISLDFYNTGKVKLSNLMTKVIGDFDMQNNSNFIGNFDTGASDSFEIDVVPKKIGVAKGTIIFSYDEPSGEHKEIKKDFTFNAENAPPPPKLPDPNENASKGKKTKIIVGILVGSAAIITSIVIIRKKKKKKEGIDLDE